MAEEKDGMNDDQNNKYWALQEDDSEEENGMVNRSAKFQFTPASFQVPTLIQPYAGGTTYNVGGLVLEMGIDDPDL